MQPDADAGRDSAPLIAPRILYLRLFRACNATCIMCDCASVRRVRTPDVALVGKVLRNAARAGVRELRITGGEPLLLDGLETIVHGASSAGLTVRILTNGGLLTADRCSTLVGAGAREFVVSLDGASAEVHDQIRGMRGLFARSIEGIRNLRHVAGTRDVPLLIGITTVIMRDNFTTLPEFVELLSRLRVDFWAWNPLKDRPGQRLSVSEVGAFHELAAQIVARLKVAGIRLLVPHSAPGKPDVRIFGDTATAVRRSAEDAYPANEICSVLETVAYWDVESSTLHACPLTIHRTDHAATSFDYRSDALDVVWNAAEYRDRRREFARTTMVACRGCEPAMRLLHQQLQSGRGAVC